jgi:hypothetical protein
LTFKFELVFQTINQQFGGVNFAVEQDRLKWTMFLTGWNFSNMSN